MVAFVGHRAAAATHYQRRGAAVVQADGLEPCDGRADEPPSYMAVSFLPKQAIKLAVQKREGVVPEANSPGNLPMTDSARSGLSVVGPLRRDRQRDPCHILRSEVTRWMR
jgi:hypothetical protein